MRRFSLTIRGGLLTTREVRLEISLPEGGRMGKKTSVMLTGRKCVYEGYFKMWLSGRDQVWTC